MAASVLFCGVTNASGAAIVEALLARAGVRSVVVANAQPADDCLRRLRTPSGGGRLTHCRVADLNRAADLEVVYEEALRRSGGHLQLVVNHREMDADDVWDDVITMHINSFICGTLMAMKHLGSMNGGDGGTVVNVLVVGGRTEEEYAAAHRLANDLERAFADPHYVASTAVRVLALLCARKPPPPLVEAAVMAGAGAAAGVATAAAAAAATPTGDDLG